MIFGSLIEIDKYQICREINKIILGYLLDLNKLLNILYMKQTIGNNKITTYVSGYCSQYSHSRVSNFVKEDIHYCKKYLIQYFSIRDVNF